VVHADTRRIAILGVWLITMVAFAGPVFGEPLSVVEARAAVPSTLRVEAPPSLLRGISARDPHDAPAPEFLASFPALADWPTLTTTVTDRQPIDLRSLLAPDGRWHLMEFGASATWRPLPAKLIAFGQVPYVESGRTDSAAAFDDEQDPASLGVTLQAGGFEAGAQYRSVGKRLERLVRAPAALRDREGHEEWMAQRLGVLRLRLATSELSDNVDRNPALPRTTKEQLALTTELAIPDWPVLGLTYAAGAATRFRLLPHGREASAPDRYDFESITGSAYYYGGSRWNVTASSTLTQSRHVVRRDDEPTATSQELYLTLRLHEALTLVPMVSLGQEWSFVRSDTNTAGLTLSCAPPASRWWASTFVSYTSNQTSDGSTDVHTVSLTSTLRFALGGWLPAGSAISVEAGYDHYVDTVFPQINSRAVSAFVLLKITGF
jgi:hypothetical protein